MFLFCSYFFISFSLVVLIKFVLIKKQSVGCFTYFKTMRVLFEWMFFNLIKEINRSLSNVFNSIKEITNRLRKEINRLQSKGMSNIYLNVTIETFSKLRFSGFVTRSVFGELQLTQISLFLFLLFKILVAT